MKDERIAIFLPSLRGGGAERMMLNLAGGLADHGVLVDLILAQAEGPYLTDVPSNVRVIDLKSSRISLSLPALTRYLRNNTPSALLSALTHCNLIAIFARFLSKCDCRLVISERNTLSVSSKNIRSLRGYLIVRLARYFYPNSDALVAVSKGVADDVCDTMRFPEEKIHVIYNPVVTRELLKKQHEPLAHPWFSPGQPPVILSTGRLVKQKDFSTLIYAFSKLHAQRPLRLMILGDGEERRLLQELCSSLGVVEDVAFTGFVDNPYQYMVHADVFALSSRWEGLANVLIEALVCGCPVVSTDCPSGPREVLQGGEYGQLVPVGDVEQLAISILKVLDSPPDREKQKHRGSEFSQEKATLEYLAVLRGE